MSQPERFDLPAPGSTPRAGENTHTRNSTHRASGGRRRRAAAPAEPQVGWWARASLLGVVALITGSIFVNAITGDDAAPETQNTSANVTGESASQTAQADIGEGVPGPVPEGTLAGGALGELPAGAPYTEDSSGEYRIVGQPGAPFGAGEERTYTYVVEMESTIDPAQFGGADAFATMIDATLNNPKSWIGDKRFAFQHVREEDLDGKQPDFRFQLTTAATTHAVCGNTYKLETSCYYPIGNRVVLNEARWIRGAVPWEGDLGGYRQYLVNHELGHGLGYAAHQQCEANGELAPIMMQQTLSLSNSELFKLDPAEVYQDNGNICRPNPWPYPFTPAAG